jgi:hypothetical protein
MSEHERKVILDGLIRGDLSVPEARLRLGHFSWDSDTELVKLTRHDLVRIIDRYLGGSIDGSDVEQWAEAIEGRDDVGYETCVADWLRQVVFELANPDLAVPLGPLRAAELKSEMARE